MLNITTEILEGTTYYNFSARNVEYTISKNGDFYMLVTTDTRRRDSLSMKMIARGEKMAKAVASAIEFIEAEAVAA